MKTLNQKSDILQQIPGVVWEAYGAPDEVTQRADFVSDYAEALLGYPVQTWLSTPNFWLTIVHPGDRERAARETAAIYTGGKKGVAEFRWIAQSGAVIWVEAHCRVIFDAENHPFGMRGVTMDISTRKRLEEERLALTERTTRLQEVTAKLSEAVTPDDVAATIIDVGLRAFPAKAGMITLVAHDKETLQLVKAAGYSQEILDPLKSVSLFAPLPITDCVRGNEPIWLETASERRARYPDLFYSENKAAAIPLMARGITLGALGISFQPGVELDTELKSFILGLAQQCAQALDRALLFEYEQAARQSAEREHEKAALLAEASAVLNTSLDYQTTLRDVAKVMVPGFADWCAVELVEAGGKERRQVAVAHADPSKIELAKRLREKYPPDPAAPHGVSKVIRTGESEFMQEVSRQMILESAPDPDLVKILLELNLRSYMVVPLTARGRLFGALTFLLGDSGRNYTADDLTLAEEIGRRAGLAIDNARLFDEAQKASGSRDEMLAVVSHDLRNPLAAIKLNASMLDNKLAVATPEPVRRLNEYVKRIFHSLERAQLLIDDLQDMVRLEAGNLVVEPKPVSVTDVLQDALDILRTAGAGKNLDVLAQLDNDDTVYCDQGRIGQVLSNLLGNAAKYTPPGGQVSISAVTEDGLVVFTVADSGPGIQPDQLERVFDKFWQAKATARLGTGLGLFISRGIISAHGGKIWAEAAPVGGAVFKFTLPRATVPGRA
jgi:PAS domain S-box-containing protein